MAARGMRTHEISKTLSARRAQEQEEAFVSGPDISQGQKWLVSSAVVHLLLLKELHVMGIAPISQRGG